MIPGPTLMCPDRSGLSLSIVELAVATGLSHPALTENDQLFDLLSDWFCCKVSEDKVHEAIASMASKRILRPDYAELMKSTLTPHGVNVVSSGLGGCIRMLDRGTGILDTAIILGTLNLVPETNEEDLITREDASSSDETGKEPDQ